MGIGVSVTLLAIGAILAFAVSDRVSGVDLSVVGYILMAAGALGLFLFLAIFGRRDRAVGSVTTEQTVVRDRNVY